MDWITPLAEDVKFEENIINGAVTGDYHVYSGEHYLGNVSKSGSMTVKQNHFATTEQTSSTSAMHPVRSEDTLQSLAKAYYGSEDLWYVIADANGLGFGSELQPGTTLEIPGRANEFNSHDAFSPINLSEAIGDTTPEMPYVPPPPAGGCNALASIVMIAVAVVVTGGIGLAYSGPLNPYAVGAIAGAMGSVASQAVGVVTGTIDDFNWGQVAVTAITAGVGRGMGAQLAELGAAAEEGAMIANFATKAGKLTNYGRAAVSVATSLAGAATSKLVNGHSGFSWADVAARAVSAGMGARLPGETQGSEFGLQQFIKDVGYGTLREGVSYGTNRVFGGNRSWNNREVAIDVFGNALGNSIVQEINKQNKPTEKELAIEAGRKGLSKEQLNTLSQRAEATGTSLDELLAARGSEHLYDATDSRFNSNDVFDVSQSYTLLAEQKYSYSDLSLWDKSKVLGGLLIDDVKAVSADIWENKELYGEYFMDDLRSGVIRDRIITAAKAELEIVGGAAQIATGLLAKNLPLGNKMRTGLLAHGLGNFSSGVGNLSDAIYGGDRDYHFTKNVYKSTAEFLGFDPQWGENAFYGVDLAMGATLLAQPTIQTGTVTIQSSGHVPIQIQTVRDAPAIQAMPVPMVVHDSYQIYGAYDSILTEPKK
ncbi:MULTISPECIES: DUF4225 domain-containing protein [Pseudoalteromonas]|uniref:LysM domain-containing protein n=1 Tax=Pseudoalteromonas amylolytica TaxID=1859457 RepID=A0A1S1MSE5_9GAMM|nr:MULTISPECIES: DUF4225 domain-containing protein [Pseudoalteromonas]OHU88185.1 hypothetical protein BFC16_12415 [Pseudoalteromonas sp. JW3]OHU91625.1 hypothetical protein BET10_12535 [Pseudoalteromonas amylolytica]